VGSLVDITEHKQAEEKMRFLSAITENMHDSIMVTDLQGNITYINKSTEKLFRYTQDELAGKSTGFLNIDSRAEEIEGELYETVSKGEVYQGEALNQRKDGSQFICEFTVAPLTDENGVISSYIGIQRDITEIRNLENAAIKQERLSAIGELASGVAHDFNNALQIILGGVEMALASEEPEELNQYLESIKHSAGDAASRVRRLQRFSQKRQPKKESVPININNLAEDVIKETKLLLNQFQKKGIHLEIKSDYKARSNIEGNEGELRSCLFNLVKNSTEAMPEGGKITVSTDEYDNKVYVSVSDTGTGMDKETQKKIFQPFYSTKGFEPGRGLGMTQVYSAIRDHNGDIYIKESEIGKGTVIEFAIPVSKKELIPEKKEEDYVGTARILWVDDEEMIRKICRKMLKKLGHTGDFAANGKEALEFLAKGNKYDLIITDIGMPGMSGWQLAEQIKDKGYAKKIAVVTGWGAEVFQEEKNRYNVGYVLGKPINLKKLKALIGEVLQMKNLSE
jgi:PAS domain S-box-containing protein